MATLMLCHVHQWGVATVTDVQVAGVTSNDSDMEIRDLLTLNSPTVPGTSFAEEQRKDPDVLE